MKFSDDTPRDILQAEAEKHVNARASADIKTVADLSFTSRDEIGRINWFDVTVADTRYWHFHYEVGRIYARELLDLIRNAGDAEEPEPGEGLSHHTFGFIASKIVRTWRHPIQGVYEGFFSVISEIVQEATRKS